MSDLETEVSPLLVSHDRGVEAGHNGDPADEQQELRRGLLWRLYVSHFLSTWNMRSYEFTVILLFAAAYPDTLLPTSIRGVLTNGATLLLSPAIGRWVDRNASRFHTMKITIVVQRVCVVLGCALWVCLFVPIVSESRHPSAAPELEPGRLGTVAGWASAYLSKSLIVCILMFFGIIERMCAVGNNLVMERDWVPTIASEVSKPPLHELNAVMRRIDLFSKILAPVFVSVVAVRTNSIVLAAVTALMNLSTVAVELMTAKSAWTKCRVLKLAREPKPPSVAAPAENDGEQAALGSQTEPVPEKGLMLYFHHDVYLASLSAALQSFSVLSLSGPMTTYLLTRHYSLPLITTARTAISVIEIGSTIIFPLAATILTNHPFRVMPNPMTALGITGITLQLLLLIPSVAALLLVPSTDPDPARSFPALTAAVFVFLGLSRLGHWTHNMAVQQLVQTRVPPRHRVEFSGVEMAFVSAAEIGRWASAAVWSRPAQFKGVALGGLANVVVVWVLFVIWAVRAGRPRDQT